jgi:hypothetical protein
MPRLEISKVHDAYTKPGECPLCVLEDAAETVYLKSFAHSRVMEPNVRVQTNMKGFCPAHYRKLYDGENKLGLSLVVHTHLQHVAAEVGGALDALTRAAEARNPKDRTNAAVAPLAPLRDSCFICALLHEDMDRYVETILYLWNKDPGFPEVIRSSSGFCVPHFITVVEAGSSSLPAESLRHLLPELAALMTKSLERLERELGAFSQLHQAGNTSMGTDAERSSLGRVIQKLAGSLFGAR